MTKCDVCRCRRDANGLSHSEVKVLKLVTKGKKNTEIAAELNLSVKTVEKHRSNIMTNLDIHNVVTLTHWALHHQYIELQTFAD